MHNTEIDDIIRSASAWLRNLSELLKAEGAIGPRKGSDDPAALETLHEQFFRAVQDSTCDLLKAAATRRRKWPGLAAVVISMVHAHKGSLAGPFFLDGRSVSIISAFLFHAGGHDNPAQLGANAGKSYTGSVVVGMGFIFDDTDKNGVAATIAERLRLIAKDMRNAERIFPYIGGEEVNDSPTHAHHRYIINFEQMSLEDAERWPDLLRMVRDRVKPERDRLREDTGPGAHGKKWWWQFQHPRQPLYAAISRLERVLVCPIVSNNLSFAFVSGGSVFAHKLKVFVFEGNGPFAVLQSRVHEIWARLLTSTMKDDLNYSTTDCFETFPFPENFETHAKLEVAGKDYYDFRAALMVKNNEGLTKTYNRFHDPDERSADILRLDGTRGTQRHARRRPFRITLLGAGRLYDTMGCGGGRAQSLSFTAAK